MKTPDYKYTNSKDIKINDENFIFKPEVEEWYNETLKNPRAINNTIFYGQGGTGKTTLARLVAKKNRKTTFYLLRKHWIKSQFLSRNI